MNNMDEEVYKLSKHFKFNIPAQVKHYTSPGIFPKAVYSGIDFYEYREYQVGDDIRFIDWNLFARIDKTIVRTFCSDYIGSVDIITDTSLSMKLGEPPKSQMAKKIMSLLYNIAKNSNFHTSLYTFSDSNVKMYKNYNQLQKSYLQGEVTYTDTGSTYLNKATITYISMKNSRADLIFFISDFHSHDDMSIFFETISKAGKVITLLNIYSSAEIENIRLGNVMFEEPELGIRKQVFINSLTKKLLTSNYGRFLELIRQNAIKKGLIPVQVDSKSLLYTVVNNLVRARIIKKIK